MEPGCVLTVGAPGTPSPGIERAECGSSGDPPTVQAQHLGERVKDGLGGGRGEVRQKCHVKRFGREGEEGRRGQTLTSPKP